MTAAVIAFPALVERDEVEFRRCGASSYTRAIDEAEALWGNLVSGARDLAAGRLAGLARQVEFIEAHRPEVAGDMIVLGGASVELRLVPGLLAAMVESRTE